MPEMKTIRFPGSSTVYEIVDDYARETLKGKIDGARMDAQGQLYLTAQGVDVAGPFAVSGGGTGSGGGGGVGIQSVVQTTTSAVDNGINVITVTLTDGTKSTFNIKNGSKGSTPIKGVDYFTAADKASIVSDVLSILDTSAVAHVVVDEDKNITLSGDLADGTYVLKYENADGSTTQICTLIISDGTGEPDLPDAPSFESDTTLTGWSIGTKIESNGTESQSANYAASNYIEIVDGKTYKLVKTNQSAVGAKVCYYDANGAYISTSGDVLVSGTASETADVPIADGAKYFRVRLYVGNGVQSTHTGSVTLTVAEAGGSTEPDEPTLLPHTNLVPNAKTHTNLSTVFNGIGYQNGKYASSSSPYIGDDSATVCTGCIPAQGGSVFYIKGIKLDASANSHCRVGLVQAHATNGGVITGTVKAVNQMSDYATLETLGEQYYKLTISAAYVSANFTRQPYIFISGIGTGENLIVTANEPLV